LKIAFIVLPLLSMFRTLGLTSVLEPGHAVDVATQAVLMYVGPG